MLDFSNQVNAYCILLTGKTSILPAYTTSNVQPCSTISAYITPGSNIFILGSQNLNSAVNLAISANLFIITVQQVKLCLQKQIQPSLLLRFLVSQKQAKTTLGIYLLKDPLVSS